MNRQETSPLPYAAPTFTFISISLICRPNATATQPDLQHKLEHFGLLAVAGGRGLLSTAERDYDLKAGASFLWWPGTVLHIRDLDLTGLELYLLQFNVDRTESPIGPRDAGWLCCGPIVYRPIHRLIAWLKSLNLESKQDCLTGHADYDREPDQIRALRKHIRFQEMLLTVLEQNLPSPKEDISAREAVESMIGFMRQSYHEQFSIEQLSAAAGISRWQFNTIFKQLTGSTPVDYLTQLRISRAKELLNVPGLSIKDIAQQTGFRDEFYFCRRFKQTVGDSPRQYAHLRETGPRVCTFQYVGELLMLGIKPVGANLGSLNHFLEEAGDGVYAIEEPVNERKLISLKPDMILYPDTASQRLVQQLESVAPSFPIKWHDDVYTRMRKLGDLLDKRQIAEQWIEGYEAKSKRTLARLRRYVRPGETAAAFIYDERHQKLFVYGAHNFGHTLYRALGFVPPVKVQELIQRDDSFRWIAIAPEELSLYAGEHVFMAVSPEATVSEEVRAILGSKHWLNLPAVRSGRAYIVERRWALYDPVTLDRHLDHVESLLT